MVATRFTVIEKDWCTNMDIFDCINKRRSIRKYKNLEVEKEKIDLLIKAGMAAPSACNRQPWEFIIITDDKVLTELREGMQFARYNAPVAIVVCGNTKLGKGVDAWDKDCSAAIENILLAATGLELGSIWIGIHGLPAAEKISSRVLNIPKYVIPFGMVYIGYPDEEKGIRAQYNEKRVYWQKYDQSRKHKARPKDLKHKA
ncbi:nitroreductase [Alkaliphilus hydrothermalis]|uniref:Nitroreductase n=1 Tax=Alkaliphilus hydrothermalis TaxID=1482730 RepID=A0ABS2NN96_9FIRM|nr:nitroreductase [Alkaliphilus hydrothermalis]